jgi:hypothetical protein
MLSFLFMKAWLFVLSL